ncbi:MAG: cyanophycin synthetase family protein [Armatimonadota bacterium]
MKVVEILFYDSSHVKLVVQMADPNCYTTKHAPHIPKLLFKLFPHLARHRCENDNGFSFRRECQSTEIPHLFEHLIIELQGQVLRSGTLKGETQWNWRVDPKGRFHVYVEYENEILVLGAIRVAERIIQALDRRDVESVNVEEEIRHLKELAKVGERIKPNKATAQENDPVVLEMAGYRADD